MVETSTFLGYDSASLEDAIFSVIPAPCEETVSYVPGQAQAPQAILDASSQIEDYDEETGLNVVDLGVHCIAPVAAPRDRSLGEWVQKQVTAALDNVAIPVILGGEGTVSLWGVQALLPKVDELSILHLDASANLSEGDEGESHQTVMRRALESNPSKISICQVGIRSLCQDAYDRIVDPEQNIECYFMSDINRYDDESWHEDVIKELRSPVYVTIDMSVFDPSLAPAVGNPEPGGLGWWQVARLLKKVASRRRIAAFDIVELCPREQDVVTDYTAARLAYKLMNYICAGGKMLEKQQGE